jgi:hypothetical protein
VRQHLSRSDQKLQVEARFDGTLDRVRPEVRGWLTEARRRVTELARRLPEIDLHVELPAEPPEELLRLLRTHMRSERDGGGQSRRWTGIHPRPSQRSQWIGTCRPNWTSNAG